MKYIFQNRSVLDPYQVLNRRFCQTRTKHCFVFELKSPFTAKAFRLTNSSSLVFQQAIRYYSQARNEYMVTTNAKGQKAE